MQVAASVELLKPRVFEVPLEDLFDGNALDPGARCCMLGFVPCYRVVPSRRVPGDRNFEQERPT